MSLIDLACAAGVGWEYGVSLWDLLLVLQFPWCMQYRFMLNRATARSDCLDIYGTPADCRYIGYPSETHRNTLRPRQNGRHFPEDIFKWIFFNENVRISIMISLKFVPKGPINNIPALVQTMAWRRSGAKPLYELMVFSLLTHMCFTRPQWVKPKYLEISFANALLLSCQFVLKFCTIFETIPQLKWMFWTNEVSWDLSSSCVLERYPKL